MSFLIKRALTLNSDEKVSRGVLGIPDNWPVDILDYTEGDIVPEGMELMSDVNLEQLKLENLSDYETWYEGKKQGEHLLENYKVQEYSATGLLVGVKFYQDRIGDSYTNLAKEIQYTYVEGTSFAKRVDSIIYDSKGVITGHEITRFFTETTTNKIITETEYI